MPEIEILLPIITKKGAVRAPNSLPARVSRKVIGFLDNGTGPNTDSMYERMAELLVREHGVAEVVRRRKPYTKAGQGSPDDILNELAQKCDLVINGVGL